MPIAATSKPSSPLPHLPYEVWEMILDLLDKTEDLLAFQRVCNEWKEVLLSYVMDGRLKSRALLVERLVYCGDGLHHKRNIRNTLGIRQTATPPCHHQSVLVLTGVGLFTGNDEDILDLEANVTFDRTTATISCWDSESSEPISETSLTMTTDQARKAVKTRPPEYPAHTMALHLKKPIVLEPGISYEIEHNLQPTDVKNFFSGWPITRLGADLWTCYGRPKGTELTPTWSNTYGLDGYERATILLSTSDTRTHPEFGLEFGSATRRPGRCCLEEGQMPFFLLWKC